MRMNQTTMDLKRTSAEIIDLMRRSAQAIRDAAQLGDFSEYGKPLASEDALIHRLESLADELDAAAREMKAERNTGQRIELTEADKKALTTTASSLGTGFYVPRA